MKERALEYLENDHVLHMAMISPIKRGTADIIYTGHDGVFIKDTASDVYMLASCSFDKGKELLDAAEKPSHICVYRKDIADYIYEKYRHKKYVQNLQTAYIKTEYVELSNKTLDIQPLTLAQLDWIHENYSDHLDLEYLKKRIECGAIYGGSLGGELCGFAGIHADGSMGILKVLEKFRGRGLAHELAGFMVNIMLDKGEIPFSQIEYDNEASIGLHRKLGFEVSEGFVYRLIDWE